MAKLYSARIIPYRGSWIDFELIRATCVRPYRSAPQVSATVLLRALGNDDEDLLNY